MITVVIERIFGARVIVLMFHRAPPRNHSPLFSDSAAAINRVKPSREGNLEFCPRCAHDFFGRRAQIAIHRQPPLHVSDSPWGCAYKIYPTELVYFR